MDALEPQLRTLLEDHKAFLKLTDNGKIECTLNGHTLPARLDAVSAFIQGAKFQKLSRRQAADTALQKYEPFIVQSNNFPLMLYCALTGQLIDKSVEAVKKHMKGKKFQRAKDRFASDDLELKPEPLLESFGVRPNKAAAAAAAAAVVVKQTKQQPQEEANGAAAGSEEEPGFWVPEGAESGSSEEGEGEEDDDQEEGSDAAGSSEGGDLDLEAAAGPTDSEEDDPMDEDTDAAAAGAPAAAAAAAKVKKSSSTAAVGKAKQKPQQKQGSSGKLGKAVAQNGSAAAAGTMKKHNAQRPRAAKKARH